jgi:flavin-dependent dehydrogenase
VTTATARNDAFDAVVIGAGPAGSATARWLALRGARVALVERDAFEAPRVGESLAPAVQPLLMKLGLWQEFLGLDPLPSFGTRSHWGADEPLVHSHLMNPWGSGWHVERLAFDRMMAEQACRAGATPIFGVALGDCAEAADGWCVSLSGRDRGGHASSRRTVSARVLIDATGRSARCATQLGARRMQLDRLVGAAVRCADVSVEREGYVLVETTADGWWYTAPIPDGGMIAMLMTDGDLCRRMQLTASSSWWERLGAAPVTRARVAGAQRATASAPRIVSAASHRLRRSDHHRPWLAVGDAALAVDPISGSGVARALTTAQGAAEATMAFLETGDAGAIAHYEAERDVECTRYLEERALYYGLERRWFGQPFWARRGVGAVVANPAPNLS